MPQYLDLLECLDTDSFLLSLQGFILQWGKPFEILADRCTKYKVGDTRLEKAYQNMGPTLQY